MNGSCAPRMSDKLALPPTLRSAIHCNGKESQTENDNNEEEVEGAVNGEGRPKTSLFSSKFHGLSNGSYESSGNGLVPEI